jgi:hypothetical protein
MMGLAAELITARHRGLANLLGWISGPSVIDSLHNLLRYGKKVWLYSTFDIPTQQR